MRLIDADDLSTISVDCDEHGILKRINAPTVCDIEQIRAEIIAKTGGKNHCDEYLDGYNDAMNDAYDIITKYTKGEQG